MYIRHASNINAVDGIQRFQNCVDKCMGFELRIKDVESREKNENKKETQSLQWSWFWSIRNDQICVHYSKRGT